MKTNHQYDHLGRTEILPFVPDHAKRILDVGCNTGGFGEEIKRTRSIEVWGVEPNKTAADKAMQFLDRTLCGFFDEKLAIPDEYFDAIIFNDVLEHMADPWAALELAKRKLTKSGQIIASIPNLRHIENLMHIVKDGDFMYQEEGIRDRTHLRFFTRKSAIRLFEEAGYNVLGIDGINPDWWSPSIIRRAAFRLFPNFLEETKYIQFVVSAKPDEAQSSAAPHTRPQA